MDRELADVNHKLTQKVCIELVFGSFSAIGGCKCRRKN